MSVKHRAQEPCRAAEARRGRGKKRSRAGGAVEHEQGLLGSSSFPRASPLPFTGVVDIFNPIKGDNT